MKSRSEIWYALLKEIGNACSVNTTLDMKYVQSRVGAEGDAFFFVTLPSFEKDLLRSIKSGGIPVDAFPGFGRRKVSTPTGSIHGVPKFLGGFLDLLFTSERYVLREQGFYEREFLDTPELRPVDPTEVDPLVRMAMRGIRQLCLLYSKEKSLCDSHRQDAAIRDYLKTDEQLTLPLAICEGISCLREASSRKQRKYSASCLGVLLPILTFGSIGES